MKPISITEFYQQITAFAKDELNALLPPNINKEIGHFNVFNVEEIAKNIKQKPVMPYNRRAYYKVSLISGRSRAEYADKVINIETHALLFASPKVPYHWVPLDAKQAGYFCIFMEDFLTPANIGSTLDKLPIFKAGGHPVFHISEKEAKDIALIFNKMNNELSSDYFYKYDLLRNYLLELIHYGQKLQPATALYPAHNASARVTSLFIELLERQFPIESQHQTLLLRTPKDYAERLAVHVNHLNKVLKENTNKTTTELISSRVINEAKLLLKQTDWSVSQIAYSLGFEELAHFSNFFKKQTSLTPVIFRSY